VARNRKRAKERRARRPQGAPVSASARGDLEARSDLEAPDPIEHAAPDVDLAEAQLAVGRPELAIEDEGPEEARLDEAEFEREEDEAEAAIAGVMPEPARVVEGDAKGVTVGDVAVHEPRVGIWNRLITFLQGSWRELQRVQWPDRRQVMQATGVVIGFVIVAGVFLGVADFLAGKLMNYILTGHFK
jgi:preprotein translocase SecE subunit